MKSIRENLKKLGVELESRYLIYRTDEKTLVVPYYHIRTVELKGKRIVVSTGGVERVNMDMPSEEMAMALFEELLLYLERVYL
ncbi:MAG: hypothetical protein ACK42C_01205 [Aquificaceae bacterium]|jgi:hypothetical protein|uniref:hypothetical protein n=1 Tax=Hydrogenobacter sp. Uz 6-8 TaxID=3384828 RepID=UPI000F12B74A|nr:MAG: hypothetical protein D6804_03250 [Aquificota bacterium]